MTVKQAINVLKKHNNWRRGGHVTVEGLFGNKNRKYANNKTKTN